MCSAISGKGCLFFAPKREGTSGGTLKWNPSHKPLFFCYTGHYSSHALSGTLQVHCVLESNAYFTFDLLLPLVEVTLMRHVMLDHKGAYVLA